MKCYISVLCVLSAFVAVNLAAPTTLDETVLVPFHHQVRNLKFENRFKALKNFQKSQLHFFNSSFRN